MSTFVKSAYPLPRKGCALFYRTTDYISTINQDDPLPIFESNHYNDSDNISKISNTQIKLKANKKYKLTSSLIAVFSGTTASNGEYQFYNTSSSSYVGTLGHTADYQFSYDTSGGYTPANLIIAPTTDVILELRFSRLVGTITNLSKLGSFVEIEELEAYLPASTGTQNINNIFTTAITSSDVDITDTQYSTYRFTGTLTGNHIVTMPSDIRQYKLICDCTGSYYITVKTASGTGVNIYPGDTLDVYCDGVNVVKMPVNADKLGGYSAGNASGNIPLNNSIENAGLKAQYARLLFTRSSSDTNSILDMALSDFATYGQGLHYYTIKAINPIDPARPWTVDAQAVLMGYPNYARLIAFKINSKAIAIRILNGGTWDTAWTYLTDDSGNPLHPSVATTASAANAYIGANGTTVLKSTSSRRYKTNIIDLENSDALDALRPVLYKSNPDTVPGDDPKIQHYGFIAEEVEEAAPILVQYTENEDGEKIPDGVQYDRVTVLLVKRVHELEARLKKAGI